MLKDALFPAGHKLNFLRSVSDAEVVTGQLLHHQISDRASVTDFREPDNVRVEIANMIYNSLRAVFLFSIVILNVPK